MKKLGRSACFPSLPSAHFVAPADARPLGAFCKEPMGCEWNVPLPPQQRKEDEEAEDSPTVKDKVTIASANAAASASLA